MDRVIVYPGAGAQDTDILRTNLYARRALAKLAQGIIGVNGAVFGFEALSVNGFTLTINAGAVVDTLHPEDASTYGSIAPGPVSLTQLCMLLTETVLGGGVFAAPPAGAWYNYSIFATVVNEDTDPVTFYYQNADNPAQVFRGVGNNGTAQNSTRRGTLQINVAGGSFPAGTMTYPAVSPGSFALYGVSVQPGDTSLTRIVPHPLSNFVTMKLVELSRSIQNILTYNGAVPDGSGTQLLTALEQRFVSTSGYAGVSPQHAIIIGYVPGEAPDITSDLICVIDQTYVGIFAFEGWVDANYQKKLGYTPPRQDFSNLVAFPPGAHTWQVPANVYRVRVAATGGGGAGGAGSAGNYSGGGGGAGGTIKGYVAVNPNDNLTLYVGNGGQPAGAGAISNPGENTMITFANGATLTANGGSGGNTNQPTAAGGSGGNTAGGGMVDVVGQSGGDGTDGQSSSGVMFGGNGGASYWGGGGRAGSGGGLNGQANGSGGGGGYNGNCLGGAGTVGLITIEY